MQWTGGRFATLTTPKQTPLQCAWPFDGLKHIADPRGLGQIAQRVSAAATPLGLENAMASQFLEDFRKESRGQLFHLGDFGE